jgi:hypothetical protein
MGNVLRRERERERENPAAIIREQGIFFLSSTRRQINHDYSTSERRERQKRLRESIDQPRESEEYEKKKK